jgi:hypothetical protein
LRSPQSFLVEDDGHNLPYSSQKWMMHPSVPQLPTAKLMDYNSSRFYCCQSCHGSQ